MASESLSTAPPTNGYIDRQADVRGGKPFLIGTGLRVQDIVMLYEYQQLSAEQIAREYPHLRLAQVHGALAYYFDHMEAIQQDLRESQEHFESLKATSPSKLGAKPSWGLHLERISRS